ncbi:MAG: hypothetical protein A2546_00785 [Sphingobacteriia bacterium RIFOXYD2_FULL_35_12]|nr:MAG: hypothetical protein A2472_14015 [Sphingobacteriia bacterium RIFOXYC2_FULL_35_18]OHC88164.1 MAG: hypothetical protein A2546_00785 [Sphingobacteriia bacterium RIFOXYD2_FULL_35_12]
MIGILVGLFMNNLYPSEHFLSSIFLLSRLIIFPLIVHFIWANEMIENKNRMRVNMSLFIGFKKLKGLFFQCGL